MTDRRADDTRPGKLKPKRPCPTPRKNAHKTRDAALGEALSVARKAKQSRVYRCPCGRWHVTGWTLAKYEQSQARKAGP